MNTTVYVHKLADGFNIQAVKSPAVCSADDAFIAGTIAAFVTLLEASTLYRDRKLTAVVSKQAYSCQTYIMAYMGIHGWHCVFTRCDDAYAVTIRPLP